MASKRDWLLQQLGITQWTLRRPGVLQGEVAVSLPPDVRLLVVAQPLPEHNDPLFCDVLRSLGLTPAQTYGLTPDQVAMLPEDTECNSWAGRRGAARGGRRTTTQPGTGRAFPRRECQARTLAADLSS